MSNLRRLAEQWLNTLETKPCDWEGVYASDREIARDFLINGQPDAIPFLDWIEDQGVRVSLPARNSLHEDLRDDSE